MAGEVRKWREARSSFRDHSGRTGPPARGPRFSAKRPEAPVSGHIRHRVRRSRAAALSYRSPPPEIGLDHHGLANDGLGCAVGDELAVVHDEERIRHGEEKG